MGGAKYSSHIGSKERRREDEDQMQTKYQKLTEAVRDAMTALDLANMRRSESLASWRSAGMADGVAQDEYFAATDAEEAAQKAVTIAKRALKRHCEYVRAELAAMQDGGL